jgi:RNA polymerase sigma-70 factor (ECF subfamily)
LRTWARDGVPSEPVAWLRTVARRTALNVIQRQAVLARKLPLLAFADADADVAEEDPIPDDRLRLIFICCHPALSPDARVALTLRLVCGVPTPEVAAAFLVPDATMAARITRAKKKIAAAHIPYAVPAPADLPARVDTVLTVIHLLYTTGHTARSGPAAIRDDLTDRALDLARTMHALLPDDGDTAGLLALLLVHHARRVTRTDPDGGLVKLADQDRNRWDRALIAEADRLITAALAAGPPGRFTVQAAITAVHAQAPTYADTDWPQILALYDELLRIWPSPVAALNRAVAVAEVHGPALALTTVEELARDERLTGYPYLAATRADLLRRLGRVAEAADQYRTALAQTGNEAERAYFRAQLGMVG